ncbi:hypothetical protein BS47DRAFT_1392131 [Hydnum rufescens UP504]|uniref:Dynein heavy chain n=1 Tax=Hydnum rufescens UP504 TaxID=1448309 RepID=A0A9P6DXI1_9AGAM|nr:hypothetical protein BS47DRAFT_1392131 [Hydnum rufescens UP504]
MLGVIASEIRGAVGCITCTCSRQRLDALLTSTKEMPNRMRQYTAFEYVQDVLKTFQKSNTILSELKSDALKERHWRQLFKTLKVSGQVNPLQMTLGNAYGLDLKKNEAVVKDVIIQAQGEMALEEYLKQANLVNYQNKCRLIRGWDDLFMRCSENLNSLVAMKASPYYKVFAEDVGLLHSILVRSWDQADLYRPAFTLFLSTCDPSVEFSPHISHFLLKAERPDTDKRRADLTKVQGEFWLRLRFLEKSLLQALNDSTGNILDDDKVIDALETLKREAAEITRKVEETNPLIRVDRVAAEYLSLAQACSSVFFVLEQLNIVNHFYQFSLRFFLDIFDYVLHHNPNLKTVSDYQHRLKILLNDLFITVYKRTSRALLHRDHIMLAVLLAQIKLRGVDDDIIADDLEFLLESGDVSITGTGTVSPDGQGAKFLSVEQQERLEQYARNPVFKAVKMHMMQNEQQWITFLLREAPEQEIPWPWEGTPSQAVRALRTVLLMKCFRPDRLLQATAIFAGIVFETDMTAESEYELGSTVSDEVYASTALCLVSVTDYDASYRVENLIKITGTRCAYVAMGSQEGFSQADAAIALAARQGSWVLLKNAHLAPSWLSQLEQRLQCLNPNNAFRLFVTMEANPVIPVNILRQSRVIMNELPLGIKANLLDSLRGISSSRLTQGPTEKIRLYFILAWFHAVVQERLRHAPLGWSQSYDFNDSDLAAAFGTIDIWLLSVAKGRANVDPAIIPWDAIRTLVKQSVYGGRVDSDFDQRILDSFVNELFTPEAYSLGFDLVPRTKAGDSILVVPEGTKMEDFLRWVGRLPDREPPSWLSLPPSAERVIAVWKANALLDKLQRMRTLANDEDDTPSSGPTNKGSPLQQPAWMKSLLQHSKEWMALLPSTLSTPRARAVDSQDPLLRLFARETSVGRWFEEDKSSEKFDEPPYEGHDTKALDSIQSASKHGRVPMDTQLLHLPGATGANLSTGLICTVAQRNAWSLETLRLKLDLGESGDPSGFVVEGLVLDGASWNDGKLQLTSDELVRVGQSQV